jgi:ABC-type sugar transport system ATPase subunit
MNFLMCQLARESGRIRVRMEGIEPEAWWSVPESSPDVAPIRDRPPGRLELGLRPEQIRIMEGGAGRDPIDPSTPLAISAEVRRLEMLGHETIVALGVGPYEWQIRTKVRSAPREGEQIVIGIVPSKGVWFDPETGVALQDLSAP